MTSVGVDPVPVALLLLLPVEVIEVDEVDETSEVLLELNSVVVVSISSRTMRVTNSSCS